MKIESNLNRTSTKRGEMNREVFHEVTQEMHLNCSGIQLGDELNIIPLQGRKKTISLKRTLYTIELGDIYNIISEKNHFILPRGILSSAKYQIILQGSSRIDKERTMDRFLLESLDESPFKINGVLSFKSYIERGDLVDIGFNRLEFFKHVDEDRELLHLIDPEIILSSLSILIEGETGTGKSYLAEKIHRTSGRKGRFVHINLSSFSKDLVESELFGHVKGAFTGAYSDKLGAFRESNYGTLFLDEIDSLSKEIQAKLLLFLDSSLVRPVGGHENKKIDVRLIFASGEKLDLLLEKDEMRKDFFYRLKSGHEIELRPLRKEVKKIKNFCYDFASQKSRGISLSLIKYYQTLEWPGNFRQLKAHLEKKVILGKGKKIIYDHLDEGLDENSNIENVYFYEKRFSTLKIAKYQYCQKVLAYYNQNLKTASHILGISMKTLREIEKIS